MGFGIEQEEAAHLDATAVTKWRWLANGVPLLGKPTAWQCVEARKPGIARRNVGLPGMTAEDIAAMFERFIGQMAPNLKRNANRAPTMGSSRYVCKRLRPTLPIYIGEAVAVRATQS